MSREDLKSLLLFFINWGVTTGTAITTAMLESGVDNIPKTGIILFALIVGFVQAGIIAKSLLEGRPQEQVKETITQLVAQMRNIQTVQAVTTPSEIKEVLNVPSLPKVPTANRSAGTDV